MTPTPFISIVIVQYNNSQDTIGCLESVKELNYPNYDVVVIDNASDVREFNATRLFIETLRDERFKTIYSDKNLGYAGGNNLGIKKTLEDKVDYFFILNPDTAIESNALTKLVEAAEADSRIGIAGPAINENGRIVYGSKIAWLKSELKHNSRSFGMENPETGYIIGAAMLVKKEVIKKIGLLDERYFLYFEDVDYCLRVRKAGFQLKIVAEAVVYHRPSSSTSLLGAPKLLYYHYRNAHLFNLKNGPFWAKAALPFWSVFIIIKQLIKIIFIPAKREISRAILAGTLDFYKNKFGRIDD